MFTMQTTCMACKGTGTVILDPCQSCGGEGRRDETQEVDVTIPAGVDNGVNLRVGGHGDDGQRGGPPGDLFIEITVEADSFFKREGSDVHTEVPISLSQAIFGGEVELPTLTGEVSLKVPGGTQHGDSLVLRRHGIRKLNGGDRGNHYVHFDVAIPRAEDLSARQLEIMTEYKSIEDGEEIDIENDDDRKDKDDIDNPDEKNADEGSSSFSDAFKKVRKAFE